MKELYKEKITYWLEMANNADIGSPLEFYCFRIVAHFAIRIRYANL